MKKNRLGNTGLDVSLIGYGGVISMDESQKNSDAYVGYAIENGINYFDVAPSYGDAEIKLGNSLRPYRKDVFLACKTTERKGINAKSEFENSLKTLHTDYFDVFQLHSLSSVEDAKQAFASGGALDVIVKAKQEGYVRFVGMSCHDEAAAIYALSQYEFDTVLFPTNWGLHMGKGFGTDISRMAKQKNIGFLGMKSLVHRAWAEGDDKSRFSKSWCKPFSDCDELAIAAMKYATNVLGAQILIPPGNFESFSFSVENADKAFGLLSDNEKAMLEKELENVGVKYFL